MKSIHLIILILLAGCSQEPVANTASSAPAVYHVSMLSVPSQPPLFYMTFTNEPITWGVWTGTVGNLIYATTSLLVPQKDWVVVAYFEQPAGTNPWKVGVPMTNEMMFYCNQSWPVGVDAWK